MVRYLLLFGLLSFSLTLALGQTSLSGKVTDLETGEPVIFGNVALYKNGVLITGTETDFDGNYSISNIDPGTYDVEASYTGYQSQRVTGVTVFAGKSNKLDVQLSAGVTLNVVEVVEYKVPLIEQDNTTSGAIITSEQIKNLPTRNINALAATSAGLSSSDEGGAITIRGSRSNATNYFVDGIRVQGSLIPETEIDQLQVITGGVEAQYGDVTGGIISITTKGPSNTFSGGVEVETSQYLDSYDNSLVGFNLSGPIARNKQGASILGFRLAGRYTYQKDDDPPAIDVYQVRPDKLAELEANPVIIRNGINFVAADFLKQPDVNALDARPDEDNQFYDLTAKIDARLSPAVDISLTGAYRNSRNRFTPGGWRLMNSHNNPYTYFESMRGNFRFRHRLGGSVTGGQERKAATIRNASYTLQFGYEKTQGRTEDFRHQDNLFDYGYIGKFDVDYIPVFGVAFDTVTQSLYGVHVDYREVLRSYDPSSTNQVLANYNNVFGFTPNETLNPDVLDYAFLGQGEGGININSFLALNGRVNNLYTGSWNFHTNVGSVYNNYSKNDNDIYTFSASTSFDFLPGGSEKGRHNIQWGIWHEQRVNRGYVVSPVGLWTLARQQANIHIQGIDLATADTIGFVDLPDFGSTPLLSVATTADSDIQFYRKLRESLGIPLSEFVNVDGLDPRQLRLDMFSAKELNDRGLLGYFGYDYLGNPFNGEFEEFFRPNPVTGLREFPVAPNRPIYSAAYVQDKFTFKDIIFRVGLRVDRYDANTVVPKDPYSLYEIMGAGEFHSVIGGEKPGNIGDDYKVYLESETSNAVQAYRSGDNWFKSDGTPVNGPQQIDGIRTGLVFPYYKDERVRESPNFIKDPDFDTNVSFQSYEVQFNFMPRLAFSFPISTEANFFAHYDILVQRPPSNTLATPLDYFYFFERGSAIRNNPNLRPERTIDYEVGFQQKLSNSSALKISAYYKEMRDMIQARVLFPVPIVNTYETYDNIDFGTVKGFSLSYDLRRTGNVSLSTNYTIQFADGTGSDANSQRGLNNRGNLRTLFPLSFDERHRINLIMDYRYDSGKRYTGPRIFGLDIFSNAGLNLQGTAVSGRPYTATRTPLELQGQGLKGAINGARKPWTFVLNARVDKDFNIGDRMGFNVYVRVSNLLDRRNVINVYTATGSPTDDGFLRSSRGESQLQNIANSAREVEAYLASYQWALLNPNLYSLPRRIFVGASLNF